MGSIAVLIPVLSRPHRVKPLVENLAECSAAIECRPYFLCTEGDKDEIKEISQTPATFFIVGPLEPGDYARKINEGVRSTTEPFIFLAADDLIFHLGWAERAVARWYDTGSCVIGTNDLANQTVMSGQHSTHSLVHRDYVECGTIDEAGKLLHEGYHHNYVDNEFVGTAEFRDTYSQALDSHVEHRHPIWRTADNDSTYERGRSEYASDHRIFLGRLSLWHD